MYAAIARYLAIRKEVTLQPPDHHFGDLDAYPRINVTIRDWFSQNVSRTFYGGLAGCLTLYNRYGVVPDLPGITTLINATVTMFKDQIRQVKYQIDYLDTKKDQVLESV